MSYGIELPRADPGRARPVLAVSSLAFAFPAWIAGFGSPMGLLLTLLMTTSVAQHASFVGAHPTLRWADRAIALSVGLGYTAAAAARGMIIPTCCGAAAALLYALSIQRTFWGRHARTVAHVAVHLLGALGLAAYAKLLVTTHSK
jgi:hypothetical protein